jgi:Fur family zinc uptake transcriptional regulator
LSLSAKPACTNPDRHVNHADDYVREVQRLCVERGLRLTPLRAEVLRLVAESPRPQKAYDLLASIRQSKATSAPVTAYRTLDFLLDNAFIHKLESINSFVGCHHPGVRHTAPFLICDNCDAAIELEDERISQQLDKRARAIGFRPQAKTLEVHGLCADCCLDEIPPRRVK